MDSKNRYILPWDDSANALKPGLSEVLKVADGTSRERAFTKSKLVTKSASDCYCWLMASGVRKLLACLLV